MNYRNIIKQHITICIQEELPRSELGSLTGLHLSMGRVGVVSNFK